MQARFIDHGTQLLLGEHSSKARLHTRTKRNELNCNVWFLIFHELRLIPMAATAVVRPAAMHAQRSRRTICYLIHPYHPQSQGHITKIKSTEKRRDAHQERRTCRRKENNKVVYRFNAIANRRLKPTKKTRSHSPFFYFTFYFHK